MALTGELSDLSLAELIEFFCNQRKTGRLKVIYPTGPGYFYLQSGAVVHAKVGALRGIGSPKSSGSAIAAQMGHVALPCHGRCRGRVRASRSARVCISKLRTV